MVGQSLNAIRSKHDAEYKTGEPVLEPLFVGNWGGLVFDECMWTYDGDMGWDTSCGQCVFGPDRPAEINGVANCQHCGKPIVDLPGESRDR